MKVNAVLVKSTRFAVRIVKLYQYLSETKRETVMSKQLLRCGTSIGANITEAEAAVSRKEFLSKMQIAFKECAETQYWFDLLHETSYISGKEYDSVSRDCDELRRMLSAITKTTKETL